MKSLNVLVSLAVLGSAGVGMLGFASRPAEVAPASAVAAPAEFNIDAVHSSVFFKIQHAGVSNFYGRFNKLAGSIKWDAASPETTSIAATIDSDSIDSNNKGRDDHLKGPDFFNAKQFPKIEFKSTKLTKKADKTYELAGEVTLLGKTKPVTGTVTVTGEADAGKMGYRLGMDVSFTIKRSDFGMNYGLDQKALSDEVVITVGCAGVKK